MENPYLSPEEARRRNLEHVTGGLVAQINTGLGAGTREIDIPRDSGGATMVADALRERGWHVTVKDIMLPPTGTGQDPIPCVRITVSATGNTAE